MRRHPYFRRRVLFVLADSPMLTVAVVLGCVGFGALIGWCLP